MSNEDVIRRAMTPGDQTSEKAQTDKASFWSLVAAIVGILLAVLPEVIPLFEGKNELVVQILGAAMTILGLISRTLVGLGYAAGRQGVKTAALDAARADSLRLEAEAKARLKAYEVDNTKAAPPTV